MGLLGFTPKLRLAPLLPALAAVLAAGILLWTLLPSVIEHGAAVQLLDSVEVLSPVVLGRIDQIDPKDPVEAGAPAAPGALGAPRPASLQEWIRRLAGASGLRLTLIGGDGGVVADSERSDAELAAMENHAGRPEVRQAMATGRGEAVRRSATTGQTYVYAARSLSSHGGRLFVLRLAQPLSQLEALHGRLATALGLAVAAAGLAAFLLSLWIDRRLFRPLSRLIAGAGELADGRYTHRVELPDEDELAHLAAALNRLAATVEGQVATLSSERDHLQAILAGMSEGVLVVGADGRAVLVNPAFRRLFDLAGEVTGRPVIEIVRLPELARVVDDTLAQGTPQEAAVDFVKLTTTERRTVQLASAALSSGAGDPYVHGSYGSQRPGPAGARGSTGGAVVVARDTTEFTRLAEIRRDFVANVSHELKTPLAAIRGYAETLRDGALEEPPTALRFTDRILRQCRRLQELLDDLLTLSRLESPELAWRRESVDLGALLRRTLDLISSAAEEKQVEVTVLEQPVEPLPGDPEGLERMLVNLLDNAIKYNRPGGTVEVRLEPRDGGNGSEREILLTVSDTGIGIPPEAIPRIFERFYRVDKGRSREDGGTGLGLAIVKHVAQAHGGQVEVESRMGKGSTFQVRLPFPVTTS